MVFRIAPQDDTLCTNRRNYRNQKEGKKNIRNGLVQYYVVLPTM